MTGKGVSETAPTFHGFTAASLQFYEGLERDNSREYWQSHHDLYTDAVSRPMQSLADQLAPRYGEVKIFRPYRDLRFTSDKRPYQEHASLAVRSPAAGVLYLQLSPDGLLLAGGYWQPAPDQLKRFRILQDDPKEAASLDRLLAELAERDMSLGEGSPVKTAPRGWRQDHPRIELIRRRSLTVGQLLTPGPWLEDERAWARVISGFDNAQQWNRWLSQHVGPGQEPHR